MCATITAEFYFSGSKFMIMQILAMMQEESFRVNVGRKICALVGLIKSAPIDF